MVCPSASRLARLALVKSDLSGRALVERLRKEPLPAKAIEGPAIQAVREKQKAEKSYKPRVVSVEPADGTLNIAPDTQLRVRFDRPMHPSTVQLEWKDGEQALRL